MLKYLALTATAAASELINDSLNLEELLNSHQMGFGKNQLHKPTTKNSLLGAFESPLKNKSADLEPLELSLIARQL